MSGDSASPRGRALLRDPARTKSTAFTHAEREALGLRGLLPATVSTQAMQVTRVLANLRAKTSAIEKYIFLTALQNRNERLFYRVAIEHIDEIMPLIYTPTVGQACREFAHIFRTPRGFYVNPDDRGQIREILDNWPERDVRVVVVTDGERILGLGDLGANGIGISIGKLSLYVACAGIRPEHCLPVMLDVGSDNEALRNDPLYLGVNRPRLRGSAYLELVDEFVDAVHDAFPRALIQFEDFLTPNAYALLARYRERVPCFNDDIQGTGAVALAGVMAALRITGAALGELRLMFVGAGSAATGIADMIVQAMVADGLGLAEARARAWFVDVNGLLVTSRTDLAPHNACYAVDQQQLSLVGAINLHRPQVLIGATGAPGVFTREAIAALNTHHPRPIVFALSNPTDRAECTAAQAYEWSEGRAIFASGSPFDPMQVNGQWLRPGQGNNAYVFPGVGLGAVLCGARVITCAMFLRAARALADSVSAADLATGTVYPPLADIRAVSARIATAVIEQAVAEGVAERPPKNIAAEIADYVYRPEY